MKHEFEESLGVALREEEPSPVFPGAEIEDRIRGTIAWRERSERRRRRGVGSWQGQALRTVFAVAASLALFIGGMEYGRRMAPGSRQLVPVQQGLAVGTESSPAGQTLSLPLSIQATGSRYVASLARFSETAPTLSPEQRRTAREVALALLYSATLELLRESNDDEVLRTVNRLVGERRAEVPAPRSGGQF